MKHVKRVAKGSTYLFFLSLIVISLIGGYIGVKGNQVKFTQYPQQSYEEVWFQSEARDKIALSGWFLPADSEKVVVIVHGWGGHRARTLDFIEYLQRAGLNVLSFDLRGGTGRNSYGQHESGDLAGAITWLSEQKQFPVSKISIVGISMGGTATTTYVAKHPASSVVLLSPIIDIKVAKQLALKNRHFILPGLYAAGGTLVEQVIFGVRPVNPIDTFEKITTPTLIMHADNDELSPASSLYKLKNETEQRHQSNVTFQFLGSVGHKFIDNDKSFGYPYAQQIVTFIKSH